MHDPAPGPAKVVSGADVVVYFAVMGAMLLDFVWRFEVIGWLPEDFPVKSKRNSKAG